MSKTSTPDSSAVSELQPTNSETSQESSVPAFRFPFSPDTYAPKKKDGEQWHNRNNKCNHDQRPGMAPRGTRRSMGKR